MKNDKLTRLGDTSFRVKNQINFYSNLMNKIYDFHNSNEHDLKKVYNNLLEEEIINYNKKQINNRCKLMIKQLELFKLVTCNGEKFLPTNLLLKYFELKNNKKNNFLSNTSYSFEEIFFLILILLNDKKNSESFKNFILYINDKENISDDGIALFSFCESYEEFKIYNEFSRKKILNSLFYSINENDWNKIIENKEKNLNEIVNETLKKNKNPSFKKPIKNLKEMIDFLSQCHELNNDDFERSVQNLKKIFSSIFQCFDIKENINNKEYISNNTLYIFNLFILLKKYELIYKDYLDINKRWFTNSKLLIEKLTNDNNRTFEVNKTIVNLLMQISNKFNLLDENNLNEIFDFSIGFLKNDYKELKYPFTKDEVVEVLENFSKEKESNLHKILNKKNIHNVSKFVIYEYFVNLSFSLAYQYKPKDFVEIYCGTKLDSNLLPISHCPGGKSDGLIIDTQNNETIYSTIESTILDVNSIHKENEPIKRHCIEYFNDNKLKIMNSLPTCIFVVNFELKENEIKVYTSEEQSRYIKNLDIKTCIIIVNTKIICNLLKEDKLNKLLRYYLKKGFHLIQNTTENLTKIYLNIFKNVE